MIDSKEDSVEESIIESLENKAISHSIFEEFSHFLSTGRESINFFGSEDPCNKIDTKKNSGEE